MILQILLLLAGLALVVFGADWLVDGASSIARRFGLSEFVIGLTIVGMGTSAPELVVSFIGAIQGNADISLGNVVGSNIFNTLLILGATALILPIGITRENIRRDIPINLLVTVLFVGMLSSGLSRWEGGVLLALFAWYMWDSFRKGAQTGEQPADGSTPRKVWISILMIVGGLCALIFGGRFFVNSATYIARALNVSDKFIAITILAGGTSLPELATCVAAAIKKKGQLALGNIIGSNIFNILLILGGSALITPLANNDITYVDMAALLVSAIALVAACFIGRKNQLDRLDGALFLLLFAAYTTYLIIKL
jgi:cation:H+ antiporter